MEGNLAPGKLRKRNKVRSVWISFVGRIAAQLIGSIATVTLGVIVLGRHAPAADKTPGPVPTVLIATPIRTHGETVIVMLPPAKDGQIGQKMAADIVASYEKTKAANQRADARRQTPIDPPALLSADPLADTHGTPESPRE